MREIIYWIFVIIYSAASWVAALGAMILALPFALLLLGVGLCTGIPKERIKDDIGISLSTPS